MPFVHSLVRLPDRDKQGWCAPVELGEDSPHYVSFVVPVNDNGQFFDTYSCDTVSFDGQQKSIISRELFHRGKNSFVLRIDESDLWFVVKPTQRSIRKLPYVGKLKHPDFQHLFTEIEPEKLGIFDDLCDTQHVFVMGCDPFTHYSGLPKSKSAARRQVDTK